MNKLFIFIFALFMSLGAYAKEFYIVLTPHQSTEHAQAQAKTVLKYLTTLNAGDKGHLLDGTTLQTIGRFDVPNNPKYKSEEIRIKLNGKTVSALMKFAKADHPERAAPHHSILLPQVLEHIAINKSGDEPLDVIVLASPLYRDSRNNSFDMGDNVFPSDGHLFASRSETPYGIDDKNLLSGVRLHIGYPNETLTSEVYTRAVKRFWALYMARQNGEMVTFTPNISSLFNRVDTNKPAPNYTYEYENTVKVQMTRLRVNRPAQTIYERPLSAGSLSRTLVKNANNVELGLTWDCSTCDLDLYAQPFPGAKVLFFGQSKTQEGLHLKDFTSSPKVEKGYETILFNVPIDLNKLRVLINFYHGYNPRKVRGTLRIAANGKTYAYKFHLPAIVGHKAKGIEEALNTGKSTHPQTLVIDPIQILPLQ